MQCRRIENLLSAFLDSELDEEEAWAVQTHLDHCAACRAEYAALRDTKQALAALARRTPREDLERLLQTDVGEVARQVANYPVSPRTIGAAILSLLGIWAASVQLAQHDDRNGPPLPESAYLPILGPRPAGLVIVNDPGACSLFVAPPTPQPPWNHATRPPLRLAGYAYSVAYPERK